MLFKIKDFYKKGLIMLKNNYVPIMLIVFLMSFLSIEYTDNTIMFQTDFFSNTIDEKLSGYFSNFSILTNLIDNNFIKNNLNIIFQYEFNSLTYLLTPIFRIIGSVFGFITEHSIHIAINLFISAFIIITYNIFVKNALLIGFKRFLLESNINTKLRFGTIFFIFRQKKWYRPIITICLMDIKLILWACTIVMFPIKYYEYKLIPFILAENPELKPREVFNLSKKLSKGYKHNLFCIDCVYFICKLISLLTFHIATILFLSPLKACTNSLMYIAIRDREIEKDEKLEKYFYNLMLDAKNVLVKVESIVKENEYNIKNKIYIDYNRTYSFSDYILLFFLFSFIGWLYEDILTIVQHGIIVNRGFLYGPWLPIYGFGGVLSLILFRKIFNNPIATFFSIMLIAGTIEYWTSFVIEKITGLRYWDYTGMSFNLDGRICLKGLIIFGLAGCLGIYIVAPLLANVLDKIKTNKKDIICLCISVFFVIDCIYTLFNPHFGVGITTQNDEYEQIIEEIIEPTN